MYQFLKKGLCTHFIFKLFDIIHNFNYLYHFTNIIWKSRYFAILISILFNYLWWYWFFCEWGQWCSFWNVLQEYLFLRSFFFFFDPCLENFIWGKYFGKLLGSYFGGALITSLWMSNYTHVKSILTEIEWIILPTLMNSDCKCCTWINWNGIKWTGCTH